MAEPESAVGQVATDPAGAPGASPEGQAGQSASPAQTAPTGSEAAESFFDWETIKGHPELEPLAKQLQASYTKKTQSIAKERSKVEQYDKFMQDPLGTIKPVLEQLGYQIIQGQPKSEDGKPKQYNSWDEVLADAEARAEARVMKKLEPVLGKVQDLQKQSIETYLDSNFPDWRTYEDPMMENLQKHPSLVEDPASLYRLSVPPELLEARAMKKAQQKLNGDSQQVAGQSATTKQTGDTPKGPLSFEQSVAVAKQKLAKQGLTAPRN